MTYEDFMDWKRHPVTQEVFSRLEARITEIAEILIENAGHAPVTDARWGGAVQAYRDVLDIKYGEEQ